MRPKRPYRPKRFSNINRHVSENHVSQNVLALRNIGSTLAIAVILTASWVYYYGADSPPTASAFRLHIPFVALTLACILTLITHYRSRILLKIRRTYGSLPFWLTLSLWVTFVSGGAIALLLASFAFWGGVGGLHDDPAVRATAALTTTGGLGGIVFLTVRFRSQIITENAHTDRQWSSIYQLLASPDQFRRASGIRELSILSDTHPGRYEQRAVNAICEYLRMNREADGVVEQLAVQVIREHYVRNSKQPWHKCDLDLSGVRFTQQVNFSELYFKGQVNFTAARFMRGASFRSALFAHSASFRGCAFDRECYFDDSDFREEAHFEFATFAADATFEDCSFRANCYFGAAPPEGEPPSDTFAGDANFSGCNFGGQAWFGVGVLEVNEYRPPEPYECITTFAGVCDFQGAEFTNSAHFAKVRWYDDARFGNRRTVRRRTGSITTRFRASADFEETIFCGQTSFRHTAFHADPSFNNAIFEGTVDFYRSAELFRPGFAPIELATDNIGKQLVIWADGSGLGNRRRKRRTRRQRS